MTKRIWIGLCLATAIATDGMAQGERQDRMTPFYVMPQVNVNYSDNENTHLLDWQKAVAGGASLTLGKEFSPLWGWRLSAGYNRNKGCSSWKASDRNVITFSDVEAFADLTFDFSDLVLPNRQNRHWTVMLFGGVGGAKSFDFGDKPLSLDGAYTTSPDPVLGIRGGVNVAYRLSNHVALTLEGAGFLFQDRFNGVDQARVVDARAQLSAGLVFLFGKKKVTPLPEPMPEPVPEIVKKVYVISPIMAYITPPAEVKRRKTEGQKANLDFRVNKTVLDPAFGRNAAELARIKSSIDAVKNNPELIISSIELHGYASPEGSYANNARLAQGRVEALRDELMKNYKFDTSKFTAQSTAEDWAGFRELLSKQDVADKQAMLAIIDDQTLEPDAKERKLKSLGASYRYVLQNFFPQLRHTDYAINYVVRPFDLEEAKKRILTQPEKLNLDEMFQVARAYGKGSEGYKQAIRTAVKTYPNSSIANMNAACLVLEDKDTEAARNYLNKVDDCPQKTHALGVIEALDGNYDAARSLLKKAADAGVAESAEVLKQMAD